MDLTPPQNLEAEASVIGSVLLDQKSVDSVLELLNSDDFYESRHKVIFSAIVQLFKAGTAIDYLTVTDWLTRNKQLEHAGGSAYISSLINGTPLASNITHYANIVREKSLLRGVIEGSTRTIREAFNESKSASQVLDIAESNILTLSNRAIKKDFVPIKDMLENVSDRMDELRRSGSQVRGLPTGFSAIDQVLSGLNNSDLIVLAARPGMGKTSFALDLTRNIAKAGHPVGFFSLEMSQEQLTNRIWSAESGVKLWKILSGGVSDAEMELLTEAEGRMAELPIYIDDSPTLNNIEFRTKARRLIAKHKVEFIVLDYLQLMQGATKTDSKVQEVAEISRGLKVVAKELNIPVLALAQLNRAVEYRPDAVPQLSDLRDSGSIEQDADIVMFIQREDVFKGTNNGVAKIYIKKHRNGALGTVELKYDSEFASFRNKV